MPRGLRAQISPNEGRTLLSLLQHVLPDNVGSSDIGHLIKLELVEMRDDDFDVTPLGRERLATPKR